VPPIPNHHKKLFNDRIEAISKIASAWLELRSIWRRQAEIEIPRITPYSRAMVNECLTRVFRPYHRTSLRNWMDQVCKRSDALSISSSTTLIISPSTVFAAAWQAATAVWLSGGSVVLRPSHREPVFARILSQSIRKLAPGKLPIKIFNSRMPVSKEWVRSHSIQNMVIYGTDETVRALHAKLGSVSRIIGFGTKVSLAVIPKTSHFHASALFRKLAEDILLYDTQGCLSPQGIYVEEGGPIEPLKFGKQLANAISRLNARWPSHPHSIDPLEEESFRQHWAFRSSQGKAKLLNRHVIFRYDSHFEPFGQKRCVWVAPLKKFSDLPGELGSWISRISTIGLPVETASPPHMKNGSKLRGIRWCAIGNIHEPHPSWRNGGIELLRTLMNWRTSHPTESSKNV
jgi:hypothetical protein